MPRKTPAEGDAADLLREIGFMVKERNRLNRAIEEAVIEAAAAGATITDLSTDTGYSRDTIRAWIKAAR